MNLANSARGLSNSDDDKDRGIPSVINGYLVEVLFNADHFDRAEFSPFSELINDSLSEVHD